MTPPARLGQSQKGLFHSVTLRTEGNGGVLCFKLSVDLSISVGLECNVWHRQKERNLLMYMLERVTLHMGWGCPNPTQGWLPVKEKRRHWANKHHGRAWASEVR